MKSKQLHLCEELAQTGQTISVTTRHGRVTGGRALNGAAAFLEIPYGLPPGRFEDPKPLPDGFQYEDKAYIHDRFYAAQPMNDGQAGNSDPKNKLGLGKPTENPLFLDIVLPPSYPNRTNFPVNVYIHGGFLQFGSPHGLSGQAQFIAAEREEIWVNPGYRLSAFGFLASDQPYIPGNFGFKDQWLALEWVRDNITSFGGNPNDIRISGLSAGAHSVHQLLHHVARLPAGVNSPFQRVCMQSNAIATNPKTPRELRPQYEALLRSVGLNPADSSSLSAIKNVNQVTSQTLTDTIASSLVAHGTFRGASDGEFLPGAKGEMEFQASGRFAKAIAEKGIKSIVVGDLTEEWYLYSIAHPINSSKDIEENLKRYYPDYIVKTLVKAYGELPPNLSGDKYAELFGRILSDGQVHLPVRILHRDLQKHGFPVVRYQIRWTPPQVQPKGYVTHGTDRSLWAFRSNVLTTEQVRIARSWLHAIDATIKDVEKEKKPTRRLDEMLTLKEDGTIGWTRDSRWNELEKLASILENGKEVKAKM
ncbi:carboxylesterase [Hysterangium stoloniferum]|nr:carboxylesterase [Hysterangium stoloniferum]